MCPTRITASSAQDAQETQEAVCLQTRPEFAAIQKILTHAKLVAEQVPGFKLSDEISWSTHLTKQGLYLQTGTYFHKLYTPFGMIIIGDTNSHDDIIYKSIYDRFKDKMTLQFVHNDGEQHPAWNSKFFNDGLQNQIQAQDLELYRGTDARIITDRIYEFSLYKIMAVDGESLPEPELVKDYSKDIEVAINEWNLLSKHYKKEGK